MLFASVGYKVKIYDILQEQVDNALQNIHEQLVKLETSGLLRGSLTANQQLALIKGII